MKKKGTTCKKFYPVQYENLTGLKEYLEKMAAKGWMFKEALDTCLLFEKCEPVKLNFAVEIFDQTSEYATFCNEKNMEYIEYCEAAGWNYICSNGYLQFFYSEDMSLTPIETDARMKLDSIWKAGRNMRLSNMVILACGLITLTCNITSERMDILTSYMRFSTVLLWLFLILLLLYKLVSGYIWKGRCNKAIQEGKEIPSKSAGPNLAICAVLVVGFVVWFGYGMWNHNRFGESELFRLFAVAGMVILLLGVSFLLVRVARKMKFEPDTYFGAMLAVASVITIGGIVFLFVESNVRYAKSHLIYAQEGEDEVYLDSEAYYFDNDVNLVKQPRPDVQERLQTGYATCQEVYGNFIIEYKEYYQKAMESDAHKQTNAKDKIDILIRDYRADKANRLEKAVNWAEKECYFEKNIAESFRDAEQLTDVTLSKGYHAYYVHKENEYYYLLKCSNRMVAIYSSKPLDNSALVTIAAQ